MAEVPVGAYRVSAKRRPTGPKAPVGTYAYEDAPVQVRTRKAKKKRECFLVPFVRAIQRRPQAGQKIVRPIASSASMMAKVPLQDQH